MTPERFSTIKKATELGILILPPKLYNTFIFNATTFQNKLINYSVICYTAPTSLPDIDLYIFFVCLRVRAKPYDVLYIARLI